MILSLTLQNVAMELAPSVLVEQESLFHSMRGGSRDSGLAALKHGEY